MRCFNLVIEVLLVSSSKDDTWLTLNTQGFNLVIEVLLVSSGASSHESQHLFRFNLVIEVLLVSRMRPSKVSTVGLSFQSRNRGSFGFKHMGVDGTPHNFD